MRRQSTFYGMAGKWGEDPKIIICQRENICRFPVALRANNPQCAILHKRNMSFLTSILKSVRPLIPDSAREWGAREYFNHRYKTLGTMTTLQIDSANKKATLDLELKGETQPLKVTINRYELTAVGNKTFIEIKELQTSREWINVLAGQFVKGKKFEVPEMVKALL
ncbi:MAG: hypothetical protein JWQ71_3972 [Pedosphaera sp.]|nr:hypothetical protein [Pedosphaera sp.]